LPAERLIKEIESYRPFNEQEQRDKALILACLKERADAFERSCLPAHMTASAWIVNGSGDKVLMVYHSLYDSWSWTGGHCDGDEDTLAVALKEAREETGLEHIDVLYDGIFSLEALCVEGHEKRGEYVPCHIHYNITYLLRGDEGDRLRACEGENTAVSWFSLDDALKASTEPWFVKRIYSKLNKKLEENGICRK